MCPNFQDVIAQIPERGMEGWLEKVDPSPSLNIQIAGTVCPIVTDALERVLEICKRKRDTPRVFTTIIGEACRGI